MGLWQVQHGDNTHNGPPPENLARGVGPVFKGKRSGLSRLKDRPGAVEKNKGNKIVASRKETED